MNRYDRIKLNILRNWGLPGKERLSHWFKPSVELKANLIDSIVWLKDEPIAIHTNADSYIEWTILTTGTYEDEINQLIRISLRSGDVALDIGANIGLQSIRMAQAVGIEGEVYAFEPLVYLQEKFISNIKLNKADNVRLFPFALSDTANEVDFEINTNNWNQGTFSIGNKSQGSESQKVIIKVADDLPEIKDLQRIDLIKIDVEGFEYQVLRGLKNTLIRFKPRIIFEYDSNYWVSNGQYIEECFTYLNSLNYTLYQITPVGCERITSVGNTISGNLFCLPQ